MSTVDYKQHGDTIRVTTWNTLKIDDDILLGHIIIKDGYHWFNAADTNFSCSMLKELSEKLSELNIN